MRSRLGRRGRAECHSEGAAVVEAAIVLPILILLVLGIIDFSRAYNAKQTLTHATREAVRVYTVTEDLSKTQAAFDAAVTSIGSATMELDPDTGCSLGEPLTVRASYLFDFVTLPFASVTLRSAGVMRCGG